VEPFDDCPCEKITLGMLHGLLVGLVRRLLLVAELVAEDTLSRRPCFTPIDLPDERGE